jgi:hypothetical protein
MFRNSAKAVLIRRLPPVADLEHGKGGISRVGDFALYGYGKRVA